MRPDGVEKVTGRARFGADAVAPGMLFGLVLRSPHPHARIVSIDTSRAEALQGVKAVVTAADFGEVPIASARPPANVIAREKALYEGHAIAAVAATDKAVARQALKLIEVDYAVLPHVPMSKARSKRMRRSSTRASTGGLRAAAGQALQYRGAQRIRAWRSGSRVRRGRSGHRADFKTEAAHQGYIEPHACRREFQWRWQRRPVGLHAGPFHGRATPAPSSWGSMFRACGSRHRRSAADLAARPSSSWSRWRWRFHANRAGLSK